MKNAAPFNLPGRLPALDGVGVVDAARLLAVLLMLAFFGSLVGLAFIPWQQNVTAKGRLIAYAPLERQQPIQAPISGRVTRWFVQEGDHIDAGDPIVELSDNDPQILARLERERRSVIARLEAAELSVAVAKAKVGALEGVRESANIGASLKLQIAKNKKEAAEHKLEADDAAFKTATLNVKRQRSLHEEGLVSTRKLEVAELKLETTDASLRRAKAALAAATSEVKVARADQGKTQGDAQAKIEDGAASIQKAMSDKAKAEGDLAKLETRLSRQETMRIVAPRDGTIFRIDALAGSAVAKKGDVLALLVPDTKSRAVELWLDGNDAPLVTPGRHVRLQFEGWPAVQFVGWPSVAVGTFGGEVSFVDSTDNGQGQFRIVVVPDGEEDWPDGRYLRQGVRANGWVLLNQVSLGYELWRQFNGFPPAVAPPAGSKTGAKQGKKDK